jgi:hypothetical protein
MSTPSLLEVILALLEEHAAPRWPGADGLTLDDALAEYAQAAQRGQVPGPEELVRRFPHLAGDIEAMRRD